MEPEVKIRLPGHTFASDTHVCFSLKMLLEKKAPFGVNTPNGAAREGNRR